MNKMLHSSRRAFLGKGLAFGVGATVAGRRLIVPAAAADPAEKRKGLGAARAGGSEKLLATRPS